MNKAIMELMGFSEQLKLIENKKCPTCEEDIKEEDFKNDISKKEYTISGMCQKCQDKLFG